MLKALVLMIVAEAVLGMAVVAMPRPVSVPVQAVAVLELEGKEGV